MNGTGEADLLEIVWSEVRLPYLEPFVMASFNDLLTHILSSTVFDRGPQVVWGHSSEEGKAWISSTGVIFYFQSNVIC